MERAIQDLIDVGLLVDNSALENDLEILLPMLSINHLKFLCKDMNIEVRNVKQRSDYINAIMLHSKQKSLFVARSSYIYLK